MTFIGDMAEQLEARLFVGREDEQNQFREWLLDTRKPARVWNIHGTGGTGKSWLVGQFRRLARNAGAEFALLDMRDFMPTPEGFVRELERIGGGISPELWLNGLQERRQVVLGLDSYEFGIGFDRWFRDSFLARLRADMRIVIAGRYPLDGEWRHSPVWNKRIESRPLNGFGLEETERFLERIGIGDKGYARRAFAWSGGLPLHLSLLPLPAAEPESAELPDLAALAGYWLKEAAGGNVSHLAQCASVLWSFDRESLGRASGAPVTDEDFRKLTELSFVRPARRGWYIHDAVRETIQDGFRKSKPAAYRACRAAAVRACLKTAQTRGGDTASIVRELLCHTSDSMLRAVFALPYDYSANRLETLDAHNYDEVSAYVERRKTSPRQKIHCYADFEANKLHALEITEETDALRAELVNPADWLRLDIDSVKLLRNAEGAMIGLLAAIPIHRNTLHFLMSEPVTRAYFRSLSIAERLSLMAPPEIPAGWYIRVLDAADPLDGQARSELLNAALGYIVPGKLLVQSSYEPFYIELLGRLGFSEAPEAAHTDYGEDRPAKTFALDLRREDLPAYMRRVAAASGIELEPAEPPLPSLTGREKDIAALLLEGHSNPAIAGALRLSEITVKKYVSQLLRKTGCANRSQLMRVLLAYGKELRTVD